MNPIPLRRTLLLVMTASLIGCTPAEGPNSDTGTAETAGASAVGTPYNAGPPEMGGGPVAGTDLVGSIHGTLFTMTVARLDDPPRSGCTPGDPTFVEQRNEATFLGDETRMYDVTFRVRGVMEPKIYDGGTPDPANPFVNVGGAPSTSGRENASDQYIKVRLDVSEPRQVYFLNRYHGDHTDHEVYPMDYRLTVRVRGGARLAVVLSNGNSCAITNHRNRVVDGLPSEVISQPFKDQFLYIEAEAVDEAVL